MVFQWLILNSFPVGSIINIELYKCDLNSNCTRISDFFSGHRISSAKRKKFWSNWWSPHLQRELKKNKSKPKSFEREWLSFVFVVQKELLRFECRRMTSFFFYKNGILGQSRSRHSYKFNAFELSHWKCVGIRFVSWLFLKFVSLFFHCNFSHCTQQLMRINSCAVDAKKKKKRYRLPKINHRELHRRYICSNCVFVCAVKLRLSDRCRIGSVSRLMKIQLLIRLSLLANERSKLRHRPSI